MEPSIPKTFLSAGRQKAALDEPVIPKTQNSTAASVLFSLQLGRFCVVQFQNFISGPSALFSPEEQKRRRPAVRWTKEG
eukprot:CAMPEP_0114450766 /NCGR_PEP_ID=MMETSP0104-20121206/632_1 /TAXON_ID=37642 ORGANISM="Paraphysomonas imperforata, Strain PA2" /NCGR_SAMPLE_ID=MMETSP0104 /ASSEMBLY_ACC=CAM_ASM_000202 /LENGTH=78 /DNA_ID=CAMNT_0001622923 /DNA_START=414 /DNA_END=646 /DNA_ORIENTATION=+